MNFYKHYLGDYARDTGHLTLVEHGAYRVLLDHYYATERPLPEEKVALYRICKAFTPAERRAVDMVAKDFFPAGDDGLRHNARADEEIAAARAFAEAQAVRAHKRWHGKTDAEGMPPHTSGTSPGDASHSHSQKQHKQKQPPASAGGAPDGAVALPCPHEQIIALYHEILPTCPRVAEWNEARQALLRTRWREKAKPNGRSQGYANAEGGLDYWRRFFAYVAQSDFLTGKADPQQGRAPFVATLEWLVRPSNFVKVIEGNYHR
jgi:uncharacterized protein YdaU (DUF1376 family)